MTHNTRTLRTVTIGIIFSAIVVTLGVYQFLETDGHASARQLAANSSRSKGFSESINTNDNKTTVHQAVRNDVSQPLARRASSNALAINRYKGAGVPLAQRLRDDASAISTPPPVPAAGAAVEQRFQGTRASAALVESFDGLGVGFEGPQGKANVRNPSDNSLAIGPDHVFQIVNTRVAIYTKKGKRYNETGKVLYGPVVTNAVFAGFGGQCESRNNGDAVVRFDQLAGRWLIVMPIFGRGPVRPDQPSPDYS